MLVTPLLYPLTLIGSLQQASSSSQANPPEQSARSSEVEELQKRIEVLERRTGGQSGGQIDLSGDEVPLLLPSADSNHLGRAWYQNVDVWGFVATSYIDSGQAGEHRHGGFVIPEASLFVEAHAFEHASFRVDLQLVPLGGDDNETVSTGELYAHLHDLWKNDGGYSVGLKAGRMYVPFGEEYTWFRAPDNPLITDSAPFPYGYDEGVELYGGWHDIGWTLAITDGSEERSEQASSAKAINLKLQGKVGERLDLSASFMRHGSNPESAIELSGSHIEPVGAGGDPSSAGVSPSSTVSATLYEFDARYHAGHDTSLALSFGQASIDDQVNAFDRSLSWFSIEPRLELTDDLFASVRLSEIGTYDSEEGYHFDGEILAGGNEAFGYDAKRFQRLSAGLTWKPNPHQVVKFEIGRDRFWVIDGSAIDASADNRVFFGLELVLSF